MRNKKNIRTCKGCRDKKDKNKLYRIYLDKELEVEENISSKGRGIYICKDEKCIEKFFKKNYIFKEFKNIKEEDVEKLKNKLKNKLNKK